MSYAFYKVAHIFGLFLVFTSLGGQMLHAMNGGKKDHPHKKWLGIAHGIGLLIAFVAGFGLMARLQLTFDGWLVTKIVIWLALGGIGAIAMKRQNLAKPLWLATILLGGLAAYLAVNKPF